MKKFTMKIVLFSFLFVGSIAVAQTVGIGTTLPRTTLELVGENGGGAVKAKDGLTVPKVSSLDVADGGEQGVTEGQLVYLTVAGNGDPVGFHYWSSAANDWIPLTPQASATPTFETINLSSHTVTDADIADSDHYITSQYNAGFGSVNFTLPMPSAANEGKKVCIYEQTGFSTIQITPTPGGGFSAVSAGSAACVTSASGEWVFFASF